MKQGKVMSDWKQNECEYGRYNISVGQGMLYSYDQVNVDSDEMINCLWNTLGRIKRFGGHNPNGLNVKEHSQYVAYMLLMTTGRMDLFKLGLIHDLNESVYVDMMSPLKNFLREKYDFDYNSISKEFDRKLFHHFGINPTREDFSLLKAFDIVSLDLEISAFMDPEWKFNYLHLPRETVDYFANIDTYNEFRKTHAKKLVNQTNIFKMIDKWEEWARRNDNQL